MYWRIFLVFLIRNSIKTEKSLFIKTALKAQSEATNFRLDISYLNSVGRFFLADGFKLEHSRRFRVDMFGSVVQFEAVYTSSWRTHALVDQLFLLENNVKVKTWVVRNHSGQSTNSKRFSGHINKVCYHAVSTSIPSKLGRSRRQNPARLRSAVTERPTHHSKFWLGHAHASLINNGFEMVFENGVKEQRRGGR